MNEKTPIIEKTYDYTKFKFLRENRPVSKHKVRKIADSILEDDQTAWRPIEVNKDFAIIDGQHLMRACELLGKPVYYVKNDDVQLKAIALLNAYTTSWGISNFAHYYAKQKIQSYIDCIKFAEQYHISISLAAGALTMTFHGMGGVREVFKNGRFSITHEEEARALMDEITEIRSNLVSVTTDREFYRSYTIMRQQVEFDVFRDVLLGKRLKIEPRANKKEYLREFEDVLNYEKSKNLIRLY